MIMLIPNTRKYGKLASTSNVGGVAAGDRRVKRPTKDDSTYVNHKFTNVSKDVEYGFELLQREETEIGRRRRLRCRQQPP